MITFAPGAFAPENLTSGHVLMHFRLWLLIFLATCLGAISQLSFAFGADEHRLIAALAERQLTPKVALEIRRLANAAEVRDLVNLAVWADQIRDDDLRSLPEPLRKTASWHYSNFELGRCDRALCRNDQCLTAQLPRWIKVLGDRSQKTEQRALALAMVIHLYGDLHQPLHLGFAHDKGGNTFQLSVSPKKAGAEAIATNFHALWDSMLVRANSKPARQLALEYARRAEPAGAQKVDVAAIARESCEIVQSKAFYPNSHKLSLLQLEAMRPAAELRVQLAGLRLGKLLNQILR